MNNLSDDNAVREQEIAGLLRRQDKEGMRLLYQHYSSPLYGIALRIIGRPDLAAEVLQDALLKVWQHADQYDPERGRLFTWLARITRNVAIDTLRSRQFRHNLKTVGLSNFVNEGEGGREEQPGGDPGLRRLVDLLDEKSRQVIDLLYFQDYTQQETSAALDIPLGTVKSRVRKAIAELRRLLGNESLVAFFCLIKELSEKYLGY